MELVDMRTGWKRQPILDSFREFLRGLRERGLGRKWPEFQDEVSPSDYSKPMSPARVEAWKKTCDINMNLGLFRQV
jgi:hypothetical protein